MTRRVDKISTKIWCAKELGAAELLRGRFADYSYDIHTHDKACFALITRGAIRIRTRGAEFVARAGDLYAIDADEPHAGWPVDAEGWSLRTLYVDVNELQRMLLPGATIGAPKLTGPIIQDPKLVSLFLGVHYCSETAGPSLKREEHFLDFIGRLFERHTTRTVPPRRGGREERAVSLARDFLDHNLDQQIQLMDIASVSGVPPVRLFRAFERAMGMSPHRYQRQARVRFACGLIRLGHPLASVAAAAGFADQPHLTRSFRRTMGVTPGAYAEALLAGGAL
jgi:AraC-like DNA-binding protein